jgi:hypothetical protein
MLYLSMDQTVVDKDVVLGSFLMQSKKTTLYKISYNLMISYFSQFLFLCVPIVILQN